MPTDRAVVVALPPRTGPPALSGRHPSGDSGFSLIEVLVAIFVIGTVMAGVAPFLVRSLVVSVHQRSEQVAIQVANDALERVRALDPSSLLTGRGKIEVERQWAAAPAAVADYLADSTTYVRVGSVEHKAWDPELALGSTFGAKAPLPTAPYAVDVNDMRFEQHWYVGLCWQAKATAGAPIGDCERSVAEVPFFRVVVAVTWHQRSCPAENCVYVASTLVSRGTDPVFDLKRPAPTIADPPAQAGYVNSLASYQVTSSGGRLPLTWSVTGLPPGLTMSTSALISGTPTTPGSYSVKVTVTDKDSRTDDATFAWTIVAEPVLTSPGDLVSRTGTAVSRSVVLTGGLAPLVWSQTGLPAGLTINPTTGVITGTPTTVQTVTTTITVTDAGKPVRPVSVTFAWRVLTPVTLDPIGTVSVSQGTVSPNFTPTVRGGLPPYLWEATGLPAGLTMSASNGAVSGTITWGTRYLTTVKVTDNAGGIASIPVVVNVTARNSADVQVTTPTPSNPNQTTAVNGTPTLTTARASGGTTGYTWTSTGLPTGLTLAAGGAITGKPTVRGSYAVTLTATDPTGKQARLMFTWSVT